MALGSAARVPISRRMVSLDTVNSARALPLLWAAFLTAVVAAPWLLPGYLFGTDWPGPRRFDFPTVLYSWAPLQAVFSVVAGTVGSEATGKLFVLGLLFLAGLMAFRAAPIDGFVPRAVASAIYVFNPFVFGRLHYGQMFVLAGYALLPWVAIRLRQLFAQPDVKTGLLLALALTLVGIPSSHVFLVSGVFVAAILLTQLIAADKRLEFVSRVGPSLLLAGGATVVASSYWAAPLVLGRGQIASTVAGITSGDLKAFAAIPDAHLGLVANLLGLYGFWAEDSGRFASMKVFVPLWPVVLAVLLVVAAIGAASVFRRRRDRLGAWVAGLLIAGAIALVLEMGVSNPVTTGLVTWLDSTFPLYRGMRDAGKWAALLALVYSQLLALGTAAILGWLRARPWPPARIELVGAVATGLLLALPLYYGNGLLYGMHGEIKPSSYPPGWYAADRVLAADGHPGRALFLPWHLYMSYSFIQNQNKVVAPPAPTFFSIPVLTSTNAEVGGIAAPTDPDQVAISKLVAAGQQGHWPEVLTTLNIKYVLVAREVDWASFWYLDYMPAFVKVGDFGSIVVYRHVGRQFEPPVRGPISGSP
jgi:hypothetical protein